MVEVFDAEPFIRGWPDKGPLPFLLAKLDIFDETDPVEHDVEECDDGFKHRIVWVDNTGLRCFSPSVTFKPAALIKIYRKARKEAEEIEFYASGANIH